MQRRILDGEVWRAITALRLHAGVAHVIRVAGGREGHLRGLQALALYPANSLFVDGYLATRGDAKSKVYQMIEDAGFELAVVEKPGLLAELM